MVHMPQIAPHNADLALLQKQAEQAGTASVDEAVLSYGLIDLQVNGFAGVDFNRAPITADQLDLALAQLALTGVTSVLPTLITGADEHFEQTLVALEQAVNQSKLGPHMVLGYHIEGPFLSPQDGFSGAHNANHMGPARIALYERLQKAANGKIKLVTVAPEVTGVLTLIPQLVAQNICVSLGHTAANGEHVSDAASAGAMLCTHLGNGLPQQMHKTENPLFWQLAEDRLFAMFIADGIHVTKSALQTMLRAKGVERSILSTDAVSAAGAEMPTGLYTLGEAEVERDAGGTVRIPGSKYLAGSSTTMDQMVRNVMDWYGYSFADVLTMTRTNPLKVLGKLPENLNSKTEQNFVEWQRHSTGLAVKRTYVGPYKIERELS